MALVETSEWNMDSITERDVRISDTILNTLKKWEDDYNNVFPSGDSLLNEPTPEQQALIEEFKKNGWVR